MNLRNYGIAIAIGLAFAVMAWANQLVDQGKPGQFGPWPVTTAADSGISVTQQQCGAMTNAITSVGVAAVNTPASQLSGRMFITLCNSLQNAGTPLVKCRTDGTAPVMAATNAGDVLGIGDCITYPISSSVVPSCISDTAATYVTSFECK